MNEFIFNFFETVDYNYIDLLFTGMIMAIGFLTLPLGLILSGILLKLESLRKKCLWWGNNYVVAKSLSYASKKRLKKLITRKNIRIIYKEIL